MTSVRENLIAARALIDTPERFVQMRAAAAALDAVTTSGSEERKALYSCISGANDRRYPTDWANWTSVMARFDRAIATLPLHEGSGE